MKLKIKQFRDLSNLEINLNNNVISGRNGSGKTSIMEAFYFVIDGKNSRGMTVGGEIYPQNAIHVSDLIASVDLVINNITFSRKSIGYQKRKKGTENVELVRNINTTLTITENSMAKVVTAQEWINRISDFIPISTFRYFTNPNFFFEQKNDVNKNFIFQLLKIDNFDTSKKEYHKANISKTNKEIEGLSMQLVGISGQNEPEIVKDLSSFYDNEIAEINVKIINSTPRLTDAQLKCNSELHKEIDILKQEIFKPKMKLLEHDLPKLELKQCDRTKFEQLKLELDITNKSIFDDSEYRKKIDNNNNLIKELWNLDNLILNYDEIKSGLNCIKCATCTDILCNYRDTGIEDKSHLIRKYNKLEQEKIEPEILINKLEAAEIDFNHIKSNKIIEIEEKLKEEKALIDNIDVENKIITEKYNNDFAKIKLENEKIKLENEIIFNENKENEIIFNENKENEIKKLESLLYYPENVDNSSYIAEMEKLRDEKLLNKNEYEIYLKEKAIFDNNNSKITEITDKIDNLKKSLITFEQDFIIETNKEIEYYLNIENAINSTFNDFDIKFVLLKKLISSDEIKPDFEIIINDKMYNSNGESYINKINLCQFFQKTEKLNLPILCDEISVLDNFNFEKLMNLFKSSNNIILFERNADKLTILNQ